MPEATIFFKHTLWLYVQNCLRGKTFLALEVSTTSQSSTKNYILVHKQVSQTWSKPKPKRGVPFQTRPMACHDHNSKLKRRCALHKCSHTWRAPAVEFWTLGEALLSSGDKIIIQPDKINTLAHGYRTGCYGKPIRGPTGRQGNWQGRPGKVTGEATGFEHRGFDRDRGKLAKTPQN